MPSVFADSNYWIALFDKRDPLAETANRITESLPSDTRIITSDLVVVEVLNALSRLSIEVKRGVLSIFETPYPSRSVDVVRYSRDLYERAIPFYLRKDKEWSIVDCTSFIIVRDRKITDALTHDQHFEQAGFNAILRRGN